MSLKHDWKYQSNSDCAIELFSQVIQLRGERAEEALKNKLFFLFSSKKYELDEVVDAMALAGCAKIVRLCPRHVIKG